MNKTRRADPKEALIAFDILVHVLLGVYVWEWFISLGFDWQFITRKKAFHWPMIPYFLNRYIMLFSIIGVVIGVDVTSPINCQPLYTYDILLGASAIGLASINLSIRTMAVWSMQLYVVIPLIIIILGQFSILFQVVTLKATWAPGIGCVVTYTNGPMLMAAFIYTMIFDFIILSLMTFKLIKTSVGASSRLRTLIFKDGLIYFVIVFLANSVATIVISLNLSPITSVIANVPAAILSSIVACRIVRRLNNFSSSTPETFTMPTHCSSLEFHPSRGRPNFSTIVPRDGIHVQVETFPGSPSENKEAMRFAAACEMEREDKYDPESQAIHDPPKLPPSP